MPQVGQRTSRVTSHLQWGFPGQREQLCFWPVRTQRHGGSHRATSSAGWPTWSGKVKVLDHLGDAILKSWRMEDDFKSSCHDSTFGGCWLSHNPPQIISGGLCGVLKAIVCFVCDQVRTRDLVFQSVGHLVRFHMEKQLPIISGSSELCLKQPILQTH